MRLHDRIQRLKFAVQAIQECDFDRESRCSILFDTGPDESILLGSVAAGATLAETLLQCAIAGLGDYDGEDFVREDDFEDCQPVSTDLVKGRFDEAGDAWPVCVMITSTEELSKKLRKLIQNQ